MYNEGFSNNKIDSEKFTWKYSKYKQGNQFIEAILFIKFPSNQIILIVKMRADQLK